MADTTTYQDPNKLPEKHEASAGVFHNYDRSRLHRVEPKREQWKAGYKAWRSVIDQAKDSLMTKLVIPLIFTDVEAFAARVSGIRPAIDVSGRGEEDASRAELHRALLFYDWQALGMSFKVMEFVKAAEIYGTAWFKVFHRKVTEKKAVRRMELVEQEVDGEVIGSEEKPMVSVEDVVTWDDPHVDLCEIDQVFPDPDGKDVGSCAYIIHRLESDLHQVTSAMRGEDPLYEREVVSQLKDRLKSGNQKNTGPGGETVRQMSEELFDESTATRTADPHKRGFHLLEQWTPSHVTVVVEEFPDLPPIRREWNICGQIPFVRFTPIPDPNSIYGLSIPEVLYSLQLELSTIHSARVDNLLYSVHQMWKILRSSGINMRQLRFRPNGAVLVKDMADIQPLGRQSMDFSLYRETDEIRRWAQKVGATDTFSGVRSDLTGRTATEATILAEASGSRASLMFQILGFQALTPLGKLLIKINELFIDDEKLIRVVGDEFSDAEFVRVSPEDLLSGSGIDLDVTVDVGQMEPETRQVRLQRNERAMGVLAQLGVQKDDPLMQFFLTDYVRQMGKDRAEELIAESAQYSQQLLASIAQAQAGGSPQQAAKPPGSDAQGIGEQIAAQAGAQQNA